MHILWNLRGVPEEARKTAKVAAAQRGITLGVWVAEAIEKWAEQTVITVKTLRTLKKQLTGASAMPKEPIGQVNPESAALPEFLKDEAPSEEPARKSRAPKKFRCPHGNSEGFFCLKCDKTVARGE
jgi:hypothetical protein